MREEGKLTGMRGNKEEGAKQMKTRNPTSSLLNGQRGETGSKCTFSNTLRETNWISKEWQHNRGKCQSELKHQHSNILTVSGQLHYLLHNHGCAQSVILISHPWHGYDIPHVNRDCIEELLVSNNSNNARACTCLWAFQADRKWVTAGKVNIINPRGAGGEAWSQSRRSASVRKAVKTGLNVRV